MISQSMMGTGSVIYADDLSITALYHTFSQVQNTIEEELWTYERILHDSGPAMSTRPRTSALRMPSTHPAIRNANNR